jgi:small nuclear ribonucleoprotein (snRNP)-like protein
MSLPAARRFYDELASMVGKRVVLELADGKVYEGKLLAFDERLNLIMGDVQGAEKLVVSGALVRTLRLVEKGFDLRALAERLERVFPNQVKLREDLGAIIVLDRIRVTEAGVEGSGLSAERAREVYQEYLRELGQKSS